MGRGADWDPVRQALGDRVVWAPDLPGHGESPLDAAPLSLDAWADHVGAGIATRFDRPPLLVGYSLGGRVALRIAARHPGAFRALALVSASPGIEDQTERAERAALDDLRAAEIAADFGGFRQRWYSGPLFALDGAIAEAAAAGRGANDPAAMARVVSELSPGRQPSSWSVLDALDPTTTLLVVGERDAKYVEVADAMSQRMGGLRVQAIGGAGHAVHREAPGALAALLGAWADATGR